MLDVLTELCSRPGDGADEEEEDEEEDEEEVEEEEEVDEDEVIAEREEQPRSFQRLEPHHRQVLSGAAVDGSTGKV